MQTMKNMSMAVASLTTLVSSSSGRLSSPPFRTSVTVPQNSTGSNDALGVMIELYTNVTHWFQDKSTVAISKQLPIGHGNK